MTKNPGFKTSDRACPHCGRMICYKYKSCMDCKKEGLDAKRRLFNNVYITDGCWIWMGSRNRLGYGYFYYKGKHTRAHRASYQIFNTTPIGNLYVLHKCNNPTCVNPEHLYAGTPADNMRDKVNSGRSTQGEKHPSAKLNYKKVALIRALSKEGASQNIMASHFGVNQSQISRIVHNRLWT